MSLPGRPQGEYRGTQSTRAAPVTLMAFDYGLKRTGVAVGNTLLQQAEPLSTVQAEGDARFPLIAKLIDEWRPAALVVGVPRHPDGTAHENTQRAQRFARQLHGRFRLPVHEVDERYSTTEVLAACGGGCDVDARAAALLLQQYFYERTQVPPMHSNHQDAA
jgi:putative Holliday junction resolvase